MDKTQCKYCDEIINQNSTRCPYCQNWQKFDFQNSKSTLFLIIALLFIIAPGFIIFITILSPEDKTNVSYKVLTISESSLVTFERNDIKHIRIYGKIENPTVYKWHNVRFQVELFNSKGELRSMFKKYDDIIIPAESSTSFRLTRSTAKNFTEYSDHKIYILYAQILD